MRMRREQRAFFACMQIVVPLVALLLNELGIPGSWLMIVATVLYAFTAVRGSIWMLIGCPLAAGAGVYLVSGDIMSAVNEMCIRDRVIYAPTNRSTVIFLWVKKAPTTIARQ